MSYKHSFIEDNPYLAYTPESDTAYAPIEDDNDQDENESEQDENSDANNGGD